MDKLSENKKPFYLRFYQYQKERFPFIMHAIMIFAFTFSAVSFSRFCRGEEGFVSLYILLTGTITSFLFFFLLRIFDEFKDFEKDSKYQSYRPVPRGLIRLTELKHLAVVIIIFQIIVNIIVMPSMLIAYALIMVYMFFMTKEFFVKEWLVKHPITYLWSHMLIMPLIDFYTTGLDWLNNGLSPPDGLIYFLIVTFLNGIIIEVGRKIRSRDSEEPGVETYSYLYGSTKATAGWIIVLFFTFIFALKACLAAELGTICIYSLTIFVILCAFPAFFFLHRKDRRSARYIEISAGVWTIAMYFTLGGVPMMFRLFF